MIGYLRPLPSLWIQLQPLFIINKSLVRQMLQPLLQIRVRQFVFQYDGWEETVESVLDGHFTAFRDQAAEFGVVLSVVHAALKVDLFGLATLKLKFKFERSFYGRVVLK